MRWINPGKAFLYENENEFSVRNHVQPKMKMNEAPKRLFGQKLK